eukprot:TRINITY_DN6580_c0_g1_i1.p1 TRINITY_DN6580_c0_g1~~TRINITY_DN6580_c0_g1_i1.p1  ORF type:complete len:180 (-),score=36.33 TRINITY_DN6580_c0_g1_i1:107-646(-)
MKVEVCIDSVESAIEAEKGGASRVELCSSLFEGGLTPSVGMVKTVKKYVRIPVYVMIRPRCGDFLYSSYEYDSMRLDVEIMKSSGADGIVFGFLNSDGDIDLERTQEFILLAHPLPVTFHRAFDMTRDPYKAMEDLIKLGIPRILTSGQERSVIEGSLDSIKSTSTGKNNYYAWWWGYG